MEKQKIKSAQRMSNPKGIMVETYSGLKGSCWDVGYNSILEANIGKDVMICIKKNDKGYNTVTELMPCDDENDNAKKIVNSVPHKQENEIGLNLSDEITIAQVIIKEASSYAIMRISNSDDGQYGKHLVDAVHELTGAFKLVLYNISKIK